MISSTDWMRLSSTTCKSCLSIVKAFKITIPIPAESASKINSIGFPKTQSSSENNQQYSVEAISTELVIPW